ncbi:unnamed protein product [Notodromas monacha]|uniref:Uncharacterized protein n=1 Tax=Notodromas monacha TaxID=399045 RepID=A0A7R9BX89_9CRUS|nr:unnamed protein product [Notodromas monacha]CAG0922493.1 unnamed protein product [Notodromas monacha]
MWRSAGDRGSAITSYVVQALAWPRSDNTLLVASANQQQQQQQQQLQIPAGIVSEANLGDLRGFSGSAGAWFEAGRAAVTDIELEVELKPWTSNMFRVVAVNSVGPSEASEVSGKVCLAPESNPLLNPELIVSEPTSSGSIGVRWKRIMPLDHAGPGFNYLLSWRTVDGSWEELELPWTSDRYFFPRLSPEILLIQAKIQSKNRRGMSNADAAVVNVRRAPNRIRHDIMEPIHVEPSEPNSVRISWSRLSDNRYTRSQSTLLEFSHFKVRVCRNEACQQQQSSNPPLRGSFIDDSCKHCFCDDGQTIKDVDVNKKRRSLLLSNVWRGEPLCLSITTGLGKLFAENPVSVQLPATGSHESSKAPGAVGLLKVNPIGFTSLRISWWPSRRIYPECGQKFGTRLFNDYTVEYYRVEFASLDGTRVGPRIAAGDVIPVMRRKPNETETKNSSSNIIKDFEWYNAANLRRICQNFPASDDGQDKSELVLSELEPGTKYRIFVVPGNRFGLGPEHYVESKVPEWSDYNPSSIELAKAVALFWDHFELREISTVIENKSAIYCGVEMRAMHIEAILNWIPIRLLHRLNGESIFIQSEVFPRITNQLTVFNSHLRPGHYEIRVQFLIGHRVFSTPGNWIKTRCSDFAVASLPWEDVGFEAWYMGMLAAVGFLLTCFFFVCVCQENRKQKYFVKEEPDAISKRVEKIGIPSIVAREDIIGLDAVYDNLGLDLGHENGGSLTSEVSGSFDERASYVGEYRSDRDIARFKTRQPSASKISTTADAHNVTQKTPQVPLGFESKRAIVQQQYQQRPFYPPAIHVTDTDDQQNKLPLSVEELTRRHKSFVAAYFAAKSAGAPPPQIWTIPPPIPTIAEVEEFEPRTAVRSSTVLRSKSFKQAVESHVDEDAPAQQCRHRHEKAPDFKPGRPAQKFWKSGAQKDSKSVEDKPKMKFESGVQQLKAKPELAERKGKFTQPGLMDSRPGPSGEPSGPKPVPEESGTLSRVAGRRELSRHVSDGSSELKSRSKSCDRMEDSSSNAFAGDESMMAQGRRRTIFLASALLTVLGSDPGTAGNGGSAEILTFIRAPTDVEVAAGSRVELPCRIDGHLNNNNNNNNKGRTSVRWFRGSTYKELSIGRRIQQSDAGDLTIDNVQFLDAGLYTCVASRDGEAPIRARARLTVRPRTAVRVKPPALEVTVGRPAVFVCETNAQLKAVAGHLGDVSEKDSVSFTTAVDSIQHVNVTWMRNGAELKPSDKYIIERNPPTLEIPVTNELDTGSYTCVVSTVLDSGSGSAALIVQGVPGQPKIQYVRCAGKTATVRWVPSQSNGAPVTSYRVQANSSLAPDTWEDLKEVAGGTVSAQVTLNAWGNFSFRVVAENKIGTSFPSEPSGRPCTSPPDVPKILPGNVTVIGDAPGHFLVKWTPVPLLQSAGPDFAYLVSYKAAEPGAEWIDIVVPDAKLDSLRIPDLPIYKKYFVKVWCRNSVGPSVLTPVTITAYTGQGVPLKSPNGFCPNGVAPVNPDGSVTFSWETIDQSDVNGFFRGYKMKIRSLEHPVLGAVDLSLDRNVTEVVIDDVLIALPYDDLTATLHSPSAVTSVVEKVISHHPSFAPLMAPLSSFLATVSSSMNHPTTPTTSDIPEQDYSVPDNEAEETATRFPSTLHIGFMNEPTLVHPDPEPWVTLIESLKRDLAAVRQALEQKAAEWDRKHDALRDQLNATRVQNCGDVSPTFDQWEEMQDELGQLRDEVSALRQRVVDVEMDGRRRRR